MRQMHWAALAAMAALGFGCGSPPRGGNVTQGEQCVGDACATIVITTTRLRARVCADAYNADWSYCNTYEPGIWDIRVPAPDTYAISAQYRDGEFVGEEVSVEPGGRYEVNCRHPDDTPVEKRAVRVRSSTAPPSAKVTVDGFMTTAGPGEEVEIVMDGNIHTIAIVDPGNDFTCMRTEVNTASTMPTETPELDCGWDPSLHAWECTETEGSEVGAVSHPAVRVQTDRLELEDVADGTFPSYKGTTALDLSLIHI